MVNMNTVTDPVTAALRQVADLPGPSALPLLGNILQMRPTRVHLVAETWAKQYGPYYRFRFGRADVLVVSDPTSINAILRDRPDGFRRPAITAEVSREMGGHPGLFLAEGAEWRNQRRMVMQAFAPHAIKAYFPVLVNTGRRLQSRWEKLAAAGQEIALSADLKRYTVDIVAGLAFGAEVNTIENGDDRIQQHLENIMAGAGRRSFTPFPYWRYVRLPVDRQLERSVKAMREAVDGFIAQARVRMAADLERAQHPRNMLEAMLAAAAQEGSAVDDNTVIGNVTTMLLAGEDTTSSALAWLIWLLHRHPQALRRAQEEVLRVAPDPAAFTLEQMDALDYVDACAHEAMRLRPPAPFIPLEANRDTVIGDIHVPRNTPVWCVLRRESVSEAQLQNASEFQPERWLEGSTARQLTMPFGSGPRLCPGRYLSLLEIKVAMASLLGRFDIVSVEADAYGKDGEARELLGFVMAPAALRMRLRTRTAQTDSRPGLS
jgi:cytochrome P450